MGDTWVSHELAHAREHRTPAEKSGVRLIEWGSWVRIRVFFSCLIEGATWYVLPLVMLALMGTKRAM